MEREGVWRKVKEEGGGLVSITNLESASFVCKSYCVSGECEMDTGKYRSIFHNEKRKKKMENRKCSRRVRFSR